MLLMIVGWWTASAELRMCGESDGWMDGRREGNNRPGKSRQNDESMNDESNECQARRGTKDKSLKPTVDENEHARERNNKMKF